MGTDDSFGLTTNSSDEEDAEEVLRVSFPYDDESGESVLKASPSAASVKIDYTAISLPPPKKTIPVRRQPVRTRVVNLDEPKPEERSRKPDSTALDALPGTLQQLVKAVGTIKQTTQDTLLQNATMAANLDKQAEILPRIEALQRHLDQSHKVETANQRLFDAMHEELKGYKDNFLLDSLQKPVIRDLVTLFDDLESHATRVSKFLSENKTAPDPSWQKELEASRDNLNNAVFFIVEVLNRLDVTFMAGENTVVDLKIHKVVGFEPTEESDEKNHIARVVRPGFLWRDRVFRPTDVIVKKNTSKNALPARS